MFSLCCCKVRQGHPISWMEDKPPSGCVCTYIEVHLYTCVFKAVLWRFSTESATPKRTHRHTQHVVVFNQLPFCIVCVGAEAICNGLHGLEVVKHVCYECVETRRASFNGVKKANSGWKTRMERFKRRRRKNSVEDTTIQSKKTGCL